VLAGAGHERPIPEYPYSQQDVFQEVYPAAVPEQTYYRWRKEYGGLRTDQAKRLKELERENQRLKRLLADAELDKAILKEAASGNF
jgi:putative transposase